MARESALKNKKWNREFKSKILPELEQFAYEDEKYIVRPIRTKEEFVAEGKNNRNCVARYASDAFLGRTKIFVLRDAKTPNISYVTIELSRDNKKILQCLETGNRIPPDEVREWVDNWLKKIVQDKKRRRKAA